LFLAIAVGLGFGADQRVPTLLAVAVIMTFLLIRALVFRRRKALHNLYLNVQVRDAESRDGLFAEINEHLLNEFKTLDFRRLDHSGDTLQLTYYVNISDQEQLIRTLDTLRATYPDSSVSIVEQSNLLGG
ncbi:MAG: hypothetical protein R3307_02795, partial [Anaerolineales bacterium]|nr:hypothetical protein [Anaerolineales bacterium]